MSNEVNNVIDHICEKLGCAATELTPEMAKVEIIADSVFIAFGVIMLCGGIALVLIGLKQRKAEIERVKKRNENQTHPPYMRLIYVDVDVDAYIWYFVTAVIVISFAILIIGLKLSDMLGWMYAPKAKMFTYVLKRI